MRLFLSLVSPFWGAILGRMTGVGQVCLSSFPGRCALLIKARRILASYEVPKLDSAG